MHHRISIARKAKLRLALGALAITVLGTSTGCKSGWKMPGASLLSFSRQPSEEILASQGPSLDYPTSPAMNHTPMQLASADKGAKTGAANTPGGTGIPNLAANSNGYQIGPYGMSGRATTPNTSGTGAPKTSLASTALGTPGMGSTVPASQNSGSMPNALGGSTSGTFAAAGFGDPPSLGGMATSGGLTPPPSQSPTTALTNSQAFQAGAKPSGLAGVQPTYSGNPATGASPPAIQTYGGASAYNSPYQTSNASIYGGAPLGAVAAGATQSGQAASAGMAPPATPNASGLSGYVSPSSPNGGSATPAIPPTALNAGMTASAGEPSNAYRPGSVGRQTGFDLPQPAATGNRYADASSNGSSMSNGATALPSSPGLSSPGLAIPTNSTAVPRTASPGLSAPPSMIR